jgi:hypothetical protein
MAYLRLLSPNYLPQRRRGRRELKTNGFLAHYPYRMSAYSIAHYFLYVLCVSAVNL